VESVLTIAWNRCSGSHGLSAHDRLESALRIPWITHAENPEIAGFYTLAATHVLVESLPPDVTRRLPRYPVIPAMLMGRLAIATKYQGQGLGRALVADAAIRTDSFGIGAFALVVDAKDEAAAAFYEANGIARIPDDARRLFLPIETAMQLRSSKG
jgi:GNAT superfamily N-acetyltransferase